MVKAEVEAEKATEALAEAKRVALAHAHSVEEMKRQEEARADAEARRRQHMQELEWRMNKGCNNEHALRENEKFEQQRSTGMAQALVKTLQQRRDFVEKALQQEHLNARHEMERRTKEENERAEKQARRVTAA